MRRPGVRIPLPPVFARVGEESEDCRAVALAEAVSYASSTAFSIEAKTRAASENEGLPIGIALVRKAASSCAPNIFWTD